MWPRRLRAVRRWRVAASAPMPPPRSRQQRVGQPIRRVIARRIGERLAAVPPAEIAAEEDKAEAAPIAGHPKFREPAEAETQSQDGEERKRCNIAVARYAGGEADPGVRPGGERRVQRGNEIAIGRGALPVAIAAGIGIDDGEDSVVGKRDGALIDDDARAGGFQVDGDDVAERHFGGAAVRRRPGDAVGVERDALVEPAQETAAVDVETDVVARRNSGRQGWHGKAPQEPGRKSIAETDLQSVMAGFDPAGAPMRARSGTVRDGRDEGGQDSATGGVYHRPHVRIVDREQCLGRRPSPKSMSFITWRNASAIAAIWKSRPRRPGRATARSTAAASRIAAGCSTTRRRISPTARRSIMSVPASTSPPASPPSPRNAAALISFLSIPGIFTSRRAAMSRRRLPWSSPAAPWWCTIAARPARTSRSRSISPATGAASPTRPISTMCSAAPICATSRS